MADHWLYRRGEDGQGSPGLAGLFFGLGLIVAGGYLILNRVSIYAGSYYWSRWMPNSFGLTLIPLLLGIGLLLYGKAITGWALTVAGFLIILVGILADLQMSFQPSSLFEVLLMFGMLAAGVGLAARALRNV